MVIESGHGTIEERLELLNERRTPAVIAAAKDEQLRELLEREREALAAALLKHGAILFRGFGLKTAEDFQATAALCFREKPEFSTLDWVDGLVALSDRLSEPVEAAVSCDAG